MIETLVAKSRALCADVEFAAVDATRSEPEFLYRAIRAAIAAGASTVTVCDSAGMMMPYEFNSFVKELYANVPELENVTLGVKCSDELSMAAACAVSAVRAGAAEVDVTVGGGCAPALEAAAQIIRLRGDDYGYACGLKYTELHRSVAQMKLDNAQGPQPHERLRHGHGDFRRLGRAPRRERRYRRAFKGRRAPRLRPERRGHGEGLRDPS